MTPTPDVRAPSARLFYALVPDAGVRHSLAALAREVVRESGGRAPRDENLHLTLAFLGNLPQEDIARLEAIGTLAAAAAAPFLLTLNTIGVFRNAGVGWVGPDAVPGELRQLFERLRNALDAANLPIERRAFHPHVTLARRCVRSLPEAATAPIAWRVEALTLMVSETLPEGPRYRALAAWPLAAASPLP